MRNHLLWGSETIKPPTLGKFLPPEITCEASNICTTGSTSLLMDAVYVLTMSYVTYSINVVSLDLACNKHLLSGELNHLPYLLSTSVS